MKKTVLPEQAPAPETSRPTPQELAEDIVKSTKLVPGFEDTGLRYAGNDNMGYFGCIENGVVVCSSDGSPIIWPTLAHLRIWAHNWLIQRSNIVIPAGGMPPQSKRD